MSLKVKITVWVTAGLTLILLLSFIFVYVMFIRVTTNGEIELLKEKSHTLLLRDLPGHPEYWNGPGHLDEFLIPQEMIRYITADGKVQHQIFSDEKLMQYEPVYTNHETVATRHTQDGIFIFVETPVYDNGHQVATLEIGRSLRKLGEYSNTLISILTLTLAGAVILALSSGYLYIKVIFHPLHQLISTMQNIEESGAFRRIELKRKPRRKDHPDELTLLGSTFNRMMDRLEETFHKQEQFLADASHELRTPLTVIESYASLLKRWALKDADLREEALDAIQSETAQLKRLTQNLLSLMETEKESCKHGEPFDLVALVQVTCSSMRVTSGREIELQTAAEEFQMTGDPYKIKQLLIILLDNALKYSSKSVTVELSQASADTLRLQVTDQGIGIAEEDLPHLFDRFYRTDKARSRKLGGVGLGLAIAANIVKSHEGTISFDSRLGEGTSVTVSLPRTCQ
ncbi:sensor histidine kinase [Paenibacillus hexagrammi]|uniref:histidine kinase n=1 Tax=Paenibacillus hexagrammi TaxID=2908839 RepID=A0ABY3SFT3_9BACL|nr:HAMP domain-containing sensor histidine kinase [Paenibacillus sp. YPD9-1]UJF32888.1 HAMP domain-containing histidine kinase [Paenibacillus sp. YPD9-1]